MAWVREAPHRPAARRGSARRTAPAAAGRARGRSRCPPRRRSGWPGRPRSTAMRHASALASAVGTGGQGAGGALAAGRGVVALALGLDLARRRPHRRSPAPVSSVQRISVSMARPVEHRAARRAAPAGTPCPPAPARSRRRRSPAAAGRRCPARRSRPARAAVGRRRRPTASRCCGATYMVHRRLQLGQQRPQQGGVGLARQGAKDQLDEVAAGHLGVAGHVPYTAPRGLRTRAEPVAAGLELRATRLARVGPGDGAAREFQRRGGDLGRRSRIEHAADAGGRETGDRPRRPVSGGGCDG